MSFGRIKGSGSGTDGAVGALKEMVAKIQEMKAAPHHGQKRLVIREKGKIHTHSVIDIDMKHARDIEEKGTYKFKVEEKEDSRNGQKKKHNSSTGFKAYHCGDKPIEYTAEIEKAETFSRFGSTTRNPRTKF
jgi:hypothetical protein